MIGQIGKAPAQIAQPAPAMLAVCATLSAMAQQIRIIVRCQDQPELLAWLTMTVASREDTAFAHDLDIARAVRAAGNSTELPDSHRQVLRSEIMAGILTARRQAEGGWSVVLERLGGSIDTRPAISELPSIAFAVAATLAVLHGTGVEDLEAEPRGGHGWLLERIEVAGT